MATYYPITVTVNNGYNESGSASQIVSGGTAYVNIYANAGFLAPETITVTGASYKYYPDTEQGDADRASIVLSNPTDAVSIVVDCTETTIMVQGVYLWNESLSAPDIDITQTFSSPYPTSNGIDVTSIEIEQGPYWRMTYGGYGTVYDESGNLEAEDEGWGTDRTAFRYLDFGTGCYIRGYLYAYLTEYAVKQTTYVLQGYYKWNDSLNSPSTAIKQVFATPYPVSNGESVTYITVSTWSTMYYGGVGTVYDHDDTTPLDWEGNEDFRIINYGSDGQQVSAAYYEYAIANSTKIDIAVDLSTLSGWTSVSVGTHTLRVVSKATGYKSSTGAATTFTKEASDWIDPIQTDDNLLVQQVYGAAQSDGKLTLE